MSQNEWVEKMKRETGTRKTRDSQYYCKTDSCGVPCTPGRDLKSYSANTEFSSLEMQLFSVHVDSEGEENQFLCWTGPGKRFLGKMKYPKTFLNTIGSLINITVPI